MLRGLGIEGLFESDGKPFGGMGLLSEKFGRLGTDEEDETREGSAENQEDDTRPSKKFLREALFTFCHDSALPETNDDVFDTSVSTSASVPTTLNTNASNERQPTRDLSVSTISSELKCLPKRLKAGKVAQKGRRVGPTWKL
jgi:hypothetical protein